MQCNITNKNYLNIISLLVLNVHARETVRLCGSSLKKKYRYLLRENSAADCSQKLWKADTKLNLILMTECSQIRILYLIV